MEYFDICDDNGLPVGGTVERSEAHSKGIWHRTVHIWIVNYFDGKPYVLLQKRSMNKDSFPGRLDTSSAGHMQAGDGPMESAIRELEEELGIKAIPGDLQFAGKFKVDYTKVFHEKQFIDKETAFIYVYSKPVDIEKLTLQEEELDCVEWHEFYETLDACRAHDQRFCAPVGGLEIVKMWLDEKKEA